MLRAIFLHLLFLISLAGHGQAFLTISGRVIDTDSGLPLPFASIVLMHSSQGTISNAEGVFRIILPRVHISDTLRVSMLGYDAKKISLRDSNDISNLTIKLKEAPTYLGELIVGDSLPVREILKRAYKNIAVNYPLHPFQIDGFYREIQKADDQNVSLIEAATLVHCTGFKTHSHDQYKLNQLRKSIGFENPYVPFWDNKNLLIAFLSQNFVKYKSKSLLKYKDARRGADTSIDGVRVFVVELNERDDFWLNRLYIRCDNYAIIRAEENYDSQVSPQRRWKVESNPLITAFPTFKKLQVNFRMLDGKYYPESFLMIFAATYKDTMTDKQVLDFQIDQHFIATDIRTEFLTPIAEADRLDPDVSLKQIPAKYDPLFWEKYTVLKETPLDSTIRVGLEKEIRLEEQFKKQ